MILHDATYDKRGAGHWDPDTTRYIPWGGGSRSRIPIIDLISIPRYYGFIGIDERLSEEISSLPKLYHLLQGRPAIPSGAAGPYVTKLIELSLRWMKPLEEQDAPDSDDGAAPAATSAEEDDGS
jgi:hypothetical protein